MVNRLWLSSAVAIGLWPYQALALENGLARAPQLGWNNWNAFACDVSEDLLLDTAERVVHFGYRDAGYNYVILDDCWSAGRVNGVQVPEAKKFPNGIKHISDRIHALDLKFGMYGTAGIWTCGRYPGSLGYEETDAKTFAEWGVDYLKYDNCFNAGESGTPLITHNRYKKMGDALNATGRPILYSMCNWGEDFPWKWAQTVANSWRMSGDITDSFDREDPRCPCTGDEGYNCALPGFHCSAMNILNKVSAYTDKGIPGAWNDLDMLEVGNGGMTDTEYVSHFTMWSLVKSIMIMGYDVRKTDAATLSIYLNPAVLAISQDPTGQPVHRRWRRFDEDKAETQMWSGSLAYGDFVMVFLNLGPTPQRMNATLADVFVDWGGARSKEARSAWNLYDLWGNRMDNSTANAIINTPLDGTFAGGANVTHAYYNATERPYAVGLKERDPVLLGKMAGSVEPQGLIEAEVASHGIVAYRLSLKDGPAKDEL